MDEKHVKISQFQYVLKIDSRYVEVIEITSHNLQESSLLVCFRPTLFSPRLNTSLREGRDPVFSQQCLKCTSLAHQT
jgi:hypothetical protein